MSVNKPFSQKYCELDILEIARALGIDQERLLSYVYAKPETINASVDTDRLKESASN
ncbi:hypothetical protein ABE504_24245 [Paenibacillus oryzisoli]|uniref:hypothetical protein n=1 Tax=Paenibacillus oryzisoli TaxID=1850517 RepID=UPI003D2E25C6